MAAIDPSAEPDREEENQPIRATLKLIKERNVFDSDDDDDEDDDDYDEDDIEAIKARLAGVISDEDEDMSDDDDEDSEDEKNGGPSDPTKVKQAKKEAFTKKLQQELDEMMDIATTNGVNGKGKGRADDDSDSEDLELVDSDDEDEHEELVLCTLDPEKVSSFPCMPTQDTNAASALPAASRHHCR
jgi:FK506-binding nuclear protein